MYNDPSNTLRDHLRFLLSKSCLLCQIAIVCSHARRIKSLAKAVVLILGWNSVSWKIEILQRFWFNQTVVWLSIRILKCSPGNSFVQLRLRTTGPKKVGRDALILILTSFPSNPQSDTSSSALRRVLKRINNKLE